MSQSNIKLILTTQNINKNRGMASKNLNKDRKNLSYSNILRQLNSQKNNSAQQSLSQQLQATASLRSMQQSFQNDPIDNKGSNDELSEYQNFNQYHKDDRIFLQLSPGAKGLSCQRYCRQKYIQQHLLNWEQNKQSNHNNNVQSILKKQIQERLEKNQRKRDQNINLKIHKASTSKNNHIKALKQTKDCNSNKLSNIIFNMNNPKQATFSPLKLKQELNKRKDQSKIDQENQCKTVRIKNQDQRFFIGDWKRQIDKIQGQKLQLSETKRVRSKQLQQNTNKQNKIAMPLLVSELSKSTIISSSLNNRNRIFKSKQKGLNLKQMPFHQRQKQLLKGREQKYNKLRQSKQQMEFKQCSFKPKLTPYRY